MAILRRRKNAAATLALRTKLDTAQPKKALDESPPGYDKTPELTPAYNDKSTSNSLVFRPLSKSDLDGKVLPPSYDDEVKRDHSDEEEDEVELSDEDFEDVVGCRFLPEPLHHDLQSPFTIVTQHKVGFRLAASSGGGTILLADYTNVTLGPEVFAYLHAIKNSSSIIPPKPKVLDQAFGGLVKRTISCGVLGQELQAGQKSVGLNGAEMVTWGDIVTAVYMKPTVSYSVGDALWAAHENYNCSWVDICI